jgi:hypothetical protein
MATPLTAPNLNASGALGATRVSKYILAFTQEMR